MKINQIISETTTSGLVATVSTPLGGTQSRGNPSIYGGKKVGTLFKGKKTSAPYANSINESADLSEAELQEDDIIMVPGQGRKLKTGFVPHGQSRVDHEVEMARSDLFSAAKNAQQVYSMIKELSEEEGLEGWVQEKIIKANDYLNTVREYLEGKQVQEITGGVIAGGISAESIEEGSQQVDSLVTDALKIMRGPELADAVQALKTVLGDREFSSRRGFYNFFIRQMMDMYRQKGVSEGSRKAWLKHNDLVDIEKPLAGLKSEFDKLLQTHDPEEKRKYQQGIKQRIKSEPMSGPTGALPEGAKVDRMVKHIAKSEKKLGHSKKEAENIAWATANKRGMLDNKNKKA